LESDDFARRLPHPHDRRAVLVELTDKGMATMAEMQGQRSRDAAALVSDLDVRAVKRLQNSLDAILKRLRQLVADTDGNDGGSAG
jgi:DNA-binding MarR family transcriptional regulator